LGSAIGDKTFTVTPKAVKSGIRLSNEDGHLIEIGYDPSKQEIYLDRSGAWYEIDSTSIHGAPYAADQVFEIRVVTDTGSVELFAARGQVAITDLVLPSVYPYRVTPF
jgi:sucrose-6-phosphate hydrolase SacC (GH32 family)